MNCQFSEIIITLSIPKVIERWTAKRRREREREINVAKDRNLHYRIPAPHPRIIFISIKHFSFLSEKTFLLLSPS